MTGARVSVAWGLVFEVANELGFVVLIPVGLSLYSRAAPRQLQGLMIGVFYLAMFLCNLVVGRLGGLLEQMSAVRFWLMHAGIVCAATLALATIAVWGRKVFSSADVDPLTPVGEPA